MLSHPRKKQEKAKRSRLLRNEEGKRKLMIMPVEPHESLQPKLILHLGRSPALRTNIRDSGITSVPISYPFRLQDAVFLILTTLGKGG